MRVSGASKQYKRGMKRDLRNDPRYAQTLEFFAGQLEPGLGCPSEALDVHVSPGGNELALSAIVWERAAGLPAQRVGLAPYGPGVSGQRAADVVLLESSGDDILPRWSPDGATLAFVSDRDVRGHFRLYFYAAATRVVSAHAAQLDESIENIAWSPDGSCLLLQTVGLGAERAGAGGSGVAATGDAGPDWLPAIEEAVPENLWRRLRIYQLGDASIVSASSPNLTFWEAAWCGNDALVAVASESPREGAWHQARFVRIDRTTGSVSTVYQPGAEIGLPIGTPDGRFAAIVSGCCSDRTVVAGDAIVHDFAAESVRTIDTHGADVTHLALKDAATLLYAGVRGFQTVIGEIDCRTGAARETYATGETFGRRYPFVSSTPDGAYATVVHSYTRPHAVVRIDGQVETVLIDLAHDGYARIRAGSTIEDVRWTGRDGLPIEGLLVRPNAPGPCPLVVNIHGGPVWAFTNAWQMFHRLTPFLADRGYAVFHPNPRGSSGRGQAFAQMVRGDMNGEDTHDIIRGVEALVARGIADRQRLAVTGVSYGGMMASWLVTQTTMFAAAIPVSPVTDIVSQHFTSNIPNFDTEFLRSDPADPGGKHVMRSAIRHAKNAITPTLSIAGALDRCTPPTQALEFHRALVEAGVPSELAIYPLEGHGVRQFEAFVDFCTRILMWLERYACSRQADPAGRDNMVSV